MIHNLLENDIVEKYRIEKNKLVEISALFENQLLQFITDSNNSTSPLHPHLLNSLAIITKNIRDLHTNMSQLLQSSDYDTLMNQYEREENNFRKMIKPFLLPMLFYSVTLSNNQSSNE